LVVFENLMAARCSVYRGAGTDANVTIALHGTKGFVGTTRIENAANNFEKGRKVRSGLCLCFIIAR